MERNAMNDKTEFDKGVGSGALLGAYARCGWRRAWIMWDMDNGHAHGKNDSGKGYLWIFATRKAAINHRRKQHAAKGNARLSFPFKIEGGRFFA